jgi:hypothetical protein
MARDPPVVDNTVTCEDTKSTTGLRTRGDPESETISGPVEIVLIA